MALDLGLYLLLIRAGSFRAPSALFVVLNLVLLGHLQTLLSVFFVRFQLFRLPLCKLGLYLGRVDVGVEIGHDGEDDAHQHQQRGEEDVLGPLVDEKK